MSKETWRLRRTLLSEIRVTWTPAWHQSAFVLVGGWGCSGVSPSVTFLI